MKTYLTFFWKWYAYFYDSVGELIPYQLMLQQVIECIPNENLKLLDAGCGTGNFLVYLKKQRPKVNFEGADFAPAMRKRAEKKLPGSMVRKVDISYPLPYENNYFDVIVCINALYAVRNPEDTINEFKRILSAKGMLIISTPIKKPRLSSILKEHIHYAGIMKTIPLIFHLLILGVFNLVIVLIGRSGHYHFFTRDEIETFMANSNIMTTYAKQNWLVILKRDHS